MGLRGTEWVELMHRLALLHLTLSCICLYFCFFVFLTLHNSGRVCCFICLLLVLFLLVFLLLVFLSLLLALLLLFCLFCIQQLCGLHKSPRSLDGVVLTHMEQTWSKHPTRLLHVPQHASLFHYCCGCLGYRLFYIHVFLFVHHFVCSVCVNS